MKMNEHRADLTSVTHIDALYSPVLLLVWILGGRVV